jgi:hypothetical protein
MACGHGPACFGPRWSGRHPRALLRRAGIGCPASRSAHWSLFWPRASGRRERYDDVESAASIATLLAEIDADPDGVFWV